MLIRAKRNRYYFVNENGNKSQSFFRAEEYHNGFASIEDYFKNEVSIYSLSPKDIYNNLDKIVVWEKYNCKLEMKNADSQRRAEIFEIYSVLGEYIKQTAYEYSEELKIEEYTDRLF